MTSQVAIEIFEAKYAQRSGTTVEFLHAWGRFGAPCDCDDPECEGFQMMHLRSELIAAGWTPPAEAVECSFWKGPAPGFATGLVVVFVLVAIICAAFRLWPYAGLAVGESIVMLFCRHQAVLVKKR